MSNYKMKPLHFNAASGGVNILSLQGVAECDSQYKLNTINSDSVAGGKYSPKFPLIAQP